MGASACGAAGEPVKLENVAVTYDALGRAVEAAKPSGTVEFVYAPSGAKLAVMSGQTLEEARIPLPNGGQAVYDPSGIAYYTHADELGDVRLASTPSRTLYASAAYSPYGAAYDAEGQNVNTFTGMAQDIDATFSGGQYDLLNREYNPIQGRCWRKLTPRSWPSERTVFTSRRKAVQPTSCRGPAMTGSARAKT